MDGTVVQLMRLFVRSRASVDVKVYLTSGHGRTGRKNLGGRKEMCPTFSDCARPVPKKLFVEY